MADSLGDLGFPVEDRILVLNVLRGLSDRYTHLQSLIMCQRPFPTFLQVCDDLALEITLGAQAASIYDPGSSSSSIALTAFTPSRPPTPSQSALGPRPPGPSMGGGGRGGGGEDGGGRRRRGGHSGGGSGGGARGNAPTRNPSRVRLGPLSTTRGQGTSPCGRSRGQVLRLIPRRPCSLVRSRGSPRRRGSPLPLRHPGPRRLPLCRGPRRRLLHRPGWLVGTRPPWLPSKLPL
jgi:hypothetical protein